MTTKQQNIVRSTFQSLESHENLVAELLYQRLFALEPQSKHFFRGDLDEQKKKLIRMLRIAVENIGDPSQLQPMLFNLGKIHQSYGIEPHHFKSFGDALLFALQTVLEEKFTKEVEESWKAAYQYFVITMRNFPHSDEPVQVPHH